MTRRPSRLSLLAMALAVAMAVPASPARADEAESTNQEPWATYFARARYEMQRDDFNAAREVFDEILETWADAEVRDRAVAGMASTYLQERRYARGVLYLEEGMREYGTDLRRARSLYGALERRVGRATDRARVAVRLAEEAYEDISWFNIFRIFQKFDRRRELKDAEEDLERLQELRGLFLPELLFPLPMLETTDDEAAGDESDEAAADEGDEAAADESDEAAAEEESSEKTGDETATDEAATDEAAAEETEDEAATGDDEAATDEDEDEEEAGDSPAAPSDDELSRKDAYEVLADDIEALLALIPADKLNLADEIVAGGSALAEGEEEVLSEAPSDVSTDAAAEEDEEEPAAEEDEAAEEIASEEASDVSTDAAAAEDEGGEEFAEAGEVELLPASGSPSSPDSAEATVVTSTTPTLSAPPTTLELRQAYFDTYEELQRSLRSGDAEAIRVAREAYMHALNELRSAQYGIVATSSGSTGPSAPQGSDSGGSPGAPETSTSATGPAGSSVRPASGGYGSSRLPGAGGYGDGTVRGARSSFHR